MTRLLVLFCVSPGGDYDSTQTLTFFGFGRLGAGTRVAQDAGATALNNSALFESVASVILMFGAGCELVATDLIVNCGTVAPAMR